MARIKKAWRVIIGLLIGAILLATAAYLFVNGSLVKHNRHQPTATVNTTAKQPAKHKPAVAANIAHIFIIMDENRPFDTIVGNPALPFINSLINQYSLATNYSAVTHPSLPNYLAITSGSTDGITTDCNPPSAGCIVNVRNIADQVEQSGRSWKEYAESMPSPCYAYNSGNYATKHNPFIYYSDIVNNRQRCSSHVVPFSQLNSDLKSIGTTPNFAFITPNLCNDMHNCSSAAGDYWLSQTVPQILDSKAFTTQRSLLIITWDEGYSGDNQVATIIAGSAAKRHYQSAQPANHYSLLHTIEYLWGLPPLTAQVEQAPLMTDVIN